MQKGWMSVGLALVLAGCGNATGFTALPKAGVVVQSQRVTARDPGEFVLTQPVVEKLSNISGLTNKGDSKVYPINATFEVMGQSKEGRFKIRIELSPNGQVGVNLNGQTWHAQEVRNHLSEGLRTAKLSTNGVVYEHSRMGGGVMKQPQFSPWRFFWVVKPYPSFIFPEVPKETLRLTSPGDNSGERDVRELLSQAAVVLSANQVRRPGFVWPMPGYDNGDQ